MGRGAAVAVGDGDTGRVFAGAEALLETMTVKKDTRAPFYSCFDGQTEHGKFQIKYRHLSGIE